MAHLDESGKLVPCGVTWTRSSEYGKQLKRAVIHYKLTLDELLVKIDRPERNEVLRELFRCSDEQLDQLDEICPLSKDLTLDTFKRLKR